MSVEAMTAVFKHSQSKGCTRLVLLALANEANGTGLVTAYRRSQSYLAQQANVDPDTVRRAIAGLVELGELEVLREGLGRASSDYRIVLPTLEIETPQDTGSRPRSLPPSDPAACPPQTPQGTESIIPLLPVDPPVTHLAARAADKPHRRCRIPTDWILTDTLRYSAERLGVPPAEVTNEFHKFRDFHEAKGSVMASWSAAWRTWARNYRGPRPTAAAPILPAEVDDAIARAVARAGAQP